MRYYSPVEVTTARWAEPFQIHHQTIQKGDMVIIALASANRDETVFENPKYLILHGRTTVTLPLVMVVISA